MPLVEPIISSTTMRMIDSCRVVRSPAKICGPALGRTTREMYCHHVSR